MDRPLSLIEFILSEEADHKDATGNFSLLLSQIEYAGRIIASHVRKSGLVDILESTGGKNASEDEVIKLDEYSNNLFIEVLSQIKSVHAIASEEMEDINILEKEKGEYDVFFDPLDGSKNTEINVTVGTIFSIYKKSDTLLQKGSMQIASGYILYGPSVMFVYTSGSGVNGFTLDPSIGSFLLSHKDMRIPNSGSIYSINEGNHRLYDEKIKNYLQEIKKTDDMSKARYIGSMVADVHRTLLKGGIFLYPQDSKNLDGKLRLMFEVNPLAFLVNQAGGASVSRDISPLEILPSSLHQKAPVAIGSLDNIDDFKSLTK